jgi:5-methylcytosine-specific restriction endonuclease McrA
MEQVHDDVPAWKKWFYHSKGWFKTRSAFISGRVELDGGLCQLCGEMVLGTPIIHHTVALTEENYKDPAVSLNLELLELLHPGCHNLVHEKLMRKKETIVDITDLSIDYTKR